MESPSSRQSLPVMRAPSAIALRHRRPHRLRDLQPEPHAVLQRAAVLVGAMVGHRRQERMRQIAVRVVQLDGVEADPHRALRRIDERLAHPRDVVQRSPSAAHASSGRTGMRRRSDRLPRVLIGRQRAAALPRPLRGSLAAGMRDLDAELGGAGPPAVGDDARQRRLVVVGVEPHAAVGDAAAALDMRRLDDDEARAGIGQHAEMGEMPVGGGAVVGAVLAHRRDDDAVGEFDTAELDGCEESGHAISLLALHGWPGDHKDDGARGKR